MYNQLITCKRCGDTLSLTHGSGSHAVSVALEEAGWGYAKIGVICPWCITYVAATDPTTYRENAERPTEEPKYSIDAILAEREKRYGSFAKHSALTQDLKYFMREMPKWDDLAPDQKEALEMIAHKIGRILNGDPDYDDSWKDIAGYSKLVADRLMSGQR